MNGEVPKIKAPKGYRFKIYTSQYNEQIQLFTSGKKIGHVSLVGDKSKKIYRTHSRLDSAYHQKGLGALMYARAIQYALERGWSISSSGNSSEYAQRVWRGKTIRKYFTIKLKRNENPRYDKWYAYLK